MVRKLFQLSPAKVRTVSVGTHADGGNLYLQVTQGPNGFAKSWVFRYGRAGKTHEMGLGSLATISITDARAAALEARKQLLAGVDPLQAKRAQRASVALTAAKSTTFDQAAADYIKQHESSWRHEAHRRQWIQSLADYASPVFGKVAVAAIDTDLVLKALRPIWTTQPETGRRVRARIEAVINFAVENGERANPARWKGHLEFKLDKRARKAKGVKPLAALPHAEIGAFMAKLRKQDGMAFAALEFTILTSARSAEVTGARWDELDLRAKTWTIPGIRMKNGKPHRVALSDAAIQLLGRMNTDGELVFPGLGAHGMRRALAQTAPGVTVHGFRSTFRTWAEECTSFPSAVIEMSLAHTVGSAVEKAYQRSDLVDHRRRLMDQWATYCDRPAATGTVIGIKRA